MIRLPLVRLGFAAASVLVVSASAPAWGQEAAPVPPSEVAPPLRGDDAPALPGEPASEAKPAFSTTSTTTTAAIAPVADDTAKAALPSKLLARRGSKLARQDVEPTVPVLHTDTVDLRAGGLLQIQLAPYVGSDALVSNGDPATRAGFRVRRARFGFEALFADGIGVLIAVNPLETDEEVGTIANAMMTYEAHPAAFVSVGTVKVPYARGALESSRHLASIERALTVTALAPTRRLGVTVEGRFLGERLGYIVGWLNGTEGFADGNQYGGFVSGARLEATVVGEPDARSRKTGVALGGGGLYADEPATKGHAWSADVLASLAGAALRVEALCDKKEPQDAPVPSPAVPDSVRRCGVYGELTYLAPKLSEKFSVIQPAVRVEMFDDNRDLEDAGDVMMISAGVNAELKGDNARLQLHYLARRERHGAQRENDGVFAVFQGNF